jgi:hypothetical protein
MLFEINAPEIRALMNSEERSRVHDEFEAASRSLVVHHPLFFIEIPMVTRILERSHKDRFKNFARQSTREKN